jgi:hypothetical protein
MNLHSIEAVIAPELCFYKITPEKWLCTRRSFRENLTFKVALVDALHLNKSKQLPWQNIKELYNTNGSLALKFRTGI